jgi:coatomer protein complex subunit alpha (xenin)
LAGVEALRQGNLQIVEFSYQKNKAYERLSFLYLITGNLDKMRKMLKMVEMRGDVMSCFHNALFLGDVKEQVCGVCDIGVCSTCMMCLP